MKSHFLMLAASVATLILFATHANAVTFHGQVVSTNGGQLALAAGGEILRFHIAVDASIKLDDQPVRLEDLTPDHLAKVTAELRDGEFYATRIEARSQKRFATANRFHLKASTHRR